MRFTRSRRISPLTLALLTALAMPIHATPVGTAFTYQGRLQYQGTSANGLFDLEFRAYDGSDPGSSSLVATSRKCAAWVEDGQLSVVLELGDVFAGEKLWLEVGVVEAGPCNGSTSFTWLAPLQPITPAPYAIHAAKATLAQDADTLDGIDAASFLMTESDPTVASEVKDGVSWSELAGIPAGFADDVDHTGGTLNCYTTDWGERSECAFGSETYPAPVPTCDPGSTFTGLAEVAVSPTDCANWTANVRLRVKALCCTVD